MISPETLRRYPHFAKLNEAQLRALAMIADEVNYTSGSIILEEGKDAEWLYLLVEGCIDLSYKSEESYHPKATKIFQVGEINPGELFGISALIDPFKYNATATTSEQSTIVKFNAKSLRTISDLDCTLGYTLMQQVAKAVMERLTHTRIQLAAARD